MSESSIDTMLAPLSLEEAPTVKVAAEQSWSEHAWVSSLSLHEDVVKVLLGLVPDDEENLFEFFKERLRPDALMKAMERAGLGGHSARIWAGVTQLRKQVAATAHELNLKFATDGSTFEMAFGGIDQFYGGLDSLIGPPLPFEGSLLRQMQREHCEESDSLEPFSTSNGVENATSEYEYFFVVDPERKSSYPERGGSFREKHPDWCRRPTPLSAFEEQMRAKNLELSEGGHTQLVHEELVAGRLYTGPMYQKFNMVLRAKSQVPKLVSDWQAVCRGNNYATSIHATNSCVLKLSKLTVAACVYRGLAGKLLPAAFWRPDKYGLAGGVEYGFMSTTVDLSQARHYAAGSAPTIFEMRMGMVDRGADLAWLSQYPHEREILFGPLTGLEVRGTRVDGEALFIEVRFNANLQALTLEQVLGRNAKLLRDLCSSITLEMEHFMRTDKEWAALLKLRPEAARIAMSELKAAFDALTGERDTVYNDRQFFSDAIAEAIEIQETIANWAKGLHELVPFVGIKKKKVGATKKGVSKQQPNRKSTLEDLLCATKLYATDNEDRGLTVLMLDHIASGASALLHLTSSLTKLDIDNQEGILSKGRERVFLSALCANETLQHLALVKNLSVQGAEKLVQMVKPGGPREDMLTVVGIGAKDEEFDRNDGRFSTADMILLSAELCVHQHMQMVNVSYNDLGDGSYTLHPDGSIVFGTEKAEDVVCGLWIGRCLTFNQSITELNLKACELGFEAATGIATGLAQNGTLQDINLKGNRLGPGGGRAILEGLQANQSVRIVNLANNGIVPDGKIYINDETAPGDAAVTAALRAWAAQKKKGKKKREMILDGDEASTEESSEDESSQSDEDEPKPKGRNRAR